MLGWNDEFDYVEPWRVLESSNKAGVVSEVGHSKLVLGPVPEGWPYEYQWSGIQREVRIDVAQYPYLIAKVDNVLGYAHVDIDVLDAAKNPVKGLRASTLQTSGLSWIDLSQELDPAVYTLRIRLIVGGSNAGCSVSYDWLRFTSPEDGKILLAHPDYPFVAPISRGQ